MSELIHFVFEPLALLFGAAGVLGGIAGIIGAAGWARVERIKAEGKRRPASDASQETVLAEIQALRQQIQEMQSTGHQFDLSFDEALTRLEQRVGGLERKAAAPVVMSQPEASHQGVGRR